MKKRISTRLSAALFILPPLFSFFAGCSNIKQISIAKGGSIGLSKACDKMHLKGCDDLGDGFEKYVMNETDEATRKVQAVLKVNGNVNIETVLKVINAAASLAGKYGTEVKQFSSFMLAASKHISDDNGDAASQTVLSDGAGSTVSNGSATSYGLNGSSCVQGCGYDDQCKLDRLCIAGTCVSPAYADAFEFEFMVSKGIVDKNEERPEVKQAVTLYQHPVGEIKLLCKPGNMERCLRHCERGEAKSCYSVAKIYENLPAFNGQSEYILYAYRKACKLEMPAACVALSRLYHMGRITSKDEKNAFNLNMNACQNFKDMYACANVALFIMQGLGTDKNKDLAEQYYQTSCRLGFEAVCRQTEE